MEVFKYKYDDLFNPTLQAIHALGGSASVSEIEEKVSSILNLSEDEINDIHRGSRTKLSYRLAWARNNLKTYGLLDNSSRGVWSLTPDGLKVTSVDKQEVRRQVRKIKVTEGEVSDKGEGEEVAELKWQEELLEILQNMPPDKFERLCQRMLRESGFVNVEVTGRKGDGGIDGRGVVRVGGLLSFHVLFQCKRYRGSVTPDLIRDFRGAMVGRTDKGLFITTGTFTREAKREAQRDGAPPIDLIDGLEFAEQLKKSELGMTISKVEKVEINKDWFNNL